MPNSNLSKKELQILSDTDFLLTKHKILDKIRNKLKVCSKCINQELDSGNYLFNTSYLQPTPKISRGENYLGLPYMVLDNPRYFTKEEVFSYRIMLWWGNLISFSLHLEGPPATIAMNSLITRINKASYDEIFFCTGKTPWEYHFEANNYKDINTLSSQFLQSHFNKYGFLKLAKKATLQEWPLLENLAIINLQQLTDLTSLVRLS